MGIPFNHQCGLEGVCEELLVKNEQSRRLTQSDRRTAERPELPTTARMAAGMRTLGLREKG